MRMATTDTETALPYGVTTCSNSVLRALSCADASSRPFALDASGVALLLEDCASLSFVAVSPLSCALVFVCTDSSRAACLAVVLALFVVSTNNPAVRAATASTPATEPNIMTRFDGACSIAWAFCIRLGE